MIDAEWMSYCDKAINRLERRIQLLEAEVNKKYTYTKSLPVVTETDAIPVFDLPSKAEWSNAEREPRSWAPDKFKPELYFTNPHGIRMTIAKGEVPREILAEYKYIKEEEIISNEEENPQG